jgi:hypothetical protein
MRPKERRDSGQNVFFKARLDQIVVLGHPLPKLARAIDWRSLETQFGAVYFDKAPRSASDAAVGAKRLGQHPVSSADAVPGREQCPRRANSTGSSR